MTPARDPAHIKDLIPSAVAGTQRAAETTPERLLRHAAVLGLRGRAGLLPDAVRSEVQPGYRDERPAASPGATTVLQAILAQNDASLVREWVRLADGAGVRVLARQAPTLLDVLSGATYEIFTNADRDRAAIAPALGRVLDATGAWLAALRPQWRKLISGTTLPTNFDEDWSSGTLAQRREILRTLINVDAARAITLISSTWSADGSDARRDFIKILSEKPDLAYEPLLEPALDDRSKQVRELAATLLARTRGTKLRARMNDRVRDMTAVTRDRRTVTITLSPPKTFPKDFARDYIEEQADSGRGNRAWWLEQVFSAADLSFHAEHTGLDPGAFLEAIKDDDYFNAALSGLAAAAGHQPDARWASVLLPHLLAGKKPRIDLAQHVLDALPASESEPLRLSAAARESLPRDMGLLLIQTLSAEWPHAYSAAALDHLERCQTKYPWSLDETIKTFSRRISPALADRFEQVVINLTSGKPTPSLTAAIERLRLRSQLHKEFSA